MALRCVLGVCAIAVALLYGSVAAPAHRPLPAFKVVLAAIDRQAGRGDLSPGDAAQYRGVVQRTARLASLLPGGRAAVLRSQLAQAAAIAPKLTAPRAAAIFGQLAANDNWFAHHGTVADQTDITDADGIVYRYFSGRGFEFHPLGNFAALNAAVASKNEAATARLALALTARGVPEAGGGTAFEYYFDYSGGSAPWTSGFAQAVAAQAFARAAALDTADSSTLLAAARSAYGAIPGRLVRQTSFGPWIKLYSFNRAVVLNAQLQSAISLADYAKATSDTGAAGLAAELQSAAAHALPQFTNGYWSYYQLPDDPSPVNYQDYVVQLLQTLSHRDDRFTGAAGQFAQFATTPPVFHLANSGVGGVTFWISKPSTVHISALGGVRSLSVWSGWHTVSFRLPSRAGIFPVTIHATDWKGNSARVQTLPIVHVSSPPKKHHKAKTKRTVASAVSTTLPPLVAGAGLDQPSQAAAATAAGYGAVRMTIIWPSGSSVPDPGAVSALESLPPTSNLVLGLYAAAWPADDAGRAALAQYAASLATQVPSLHDLVLGPGPTRSSAGSYEAALAAVHDAVKAVAPLVRVDGALDGALTPKATLTALASAAAATGRTTPLMDEIAFTPAPAAGPNLWPLASVPTLITALATTFPGMPVIVDGVPASTFASALTSSACRAPVVAVILTRFADSTAALAQWAAAAQSPGRGCRSASPPATPVAPTPTPTPKPPPAHAPTPAPAPVPTPKAPPKPVDVAAADQLAFPSHISTVSPASVHLGCTAACLYLVTLQRAGDGVPVLARRGSLSGAGARTVTLPKIRIAAGSYRFSVWIVGQANPGPVSVERSEAVAAG